MFRHSLYNAIAALAIRRYAMPWRYVGAMVLAIILAGIPHSALAQDRADSVKAVYLYNFGNYIEFPVRSFKSADPEEPFTIGIVGKDHPIAPLLERIGEKKKIGPRRIVVKAIEGAKDLKCCQIVYLPAGSDPTLAAEIVESSKTLSVLLVSEVPGFLGKTSPGMVNFVVQDTQIKFELCPRTIQHAGLKVSSKLIQLALTVTD